MHVHASLAHFAPLVLLLPFVRPDETAAPVTLRFAPEAGTTWTKSFSSNASIEWEGMRVRMDGQPIPEEFLPEIDLFLTSENQLDVTDSYLAVADGRPTHLRRDYATIRADVSQDFSMSGTMGGEKVEERGVGEGASPLEGRTVDFVWDAEASEYSAQLHEPTEHAPALPEELAEDLDLRSLLPADKVSEGDSWKVDGEALSFLIAPGGDLAVEVTGEGIQPDPVYGEESLTGEATLTFEDVREVEGVRVARITIEGEVTHKGTGEGDLSDVPVVDGEATLVDTTVFGIEGVLSWNVDAGLFHSLEVDFTIDIESVTTAVDADYQHTVVMTGNSKLTATCSPAE